MKRMTSISKLSILAVTAMSLEAAVIAERKTLTPDGAQKAIAAAVEQAHRNHSGGAIAVVDDGGNLMALERGDGTMIAHWRNYTPLSKHQSRRPELCCAAYENSGHVA
jgi:hypothetical protein